MGVEGRDTPSVSSSISRFSSVAAAFMAPYDSGLESVAVESGLKAGFHDAFGCTADISQYGRVNGEFVSRVSSAYRSALGVVSNVSIRSPFDASKSHPSQPLSRHDFRMNEYL